MKHSAQTHKAARIAVIGGFTIQLGVVLLTNTVAVAEPVGSAAAKESLVLCSHVDELPAADKLAALTRGLQLAEAAVAANAQDAKAHFALFCNLGKQLQVDGISLSSWTTFRRLQHELDTTLVLAPNDPDALAGKGALLLRLPRLLGGDAAEGERLLRRALEIEPDNNAARRYLAEALEERGEAEQARAVLASR